MARDNSGLVKGLFIGILVGAAAGAVTALLFAPKTGKEFRRDIRRKSDEIKDDVSDYIRTAGSKTTEMVNRGREKAENLMEDAEKVLTDIRTRAAAGQGKVKHAVQAGIDAYRAEKDRS